MNDSYSASFASQDERRHVMCQELGHTLGLSHTSEDGSSQNTCMDYSQAASSTAPNQHDYDQLVAQYGHTDSYNSYSVSAASTASAASPSAALDVRLSPSQRDMAGAAPMGQRVRKGIFEETYVAPDGRGGVWVHHVLLAPGFEHTELLGN
jgi:hypothetical protein